MIPTLLRNPIQTIFKLIIYHNFWQICVLMSYFFLYRWSFAYRLALLDTYNQTRTRTHTHTQCITLLIYRNKNVVFWLDQLCSIFVR